MYLTCIYYSTFSYYQFTSTQTLNSIKKKNIRRSRLERDQSDQKSRNPEDKVKIDTAQESNTLTAGPRLVKPDYELSKRENYKLLVAQTDRLIREHFHLKVAVESFPRIACRADLIKLRKDIITATNTELKFIQTWIVDDISSEWWGLRISFIQDVAYICSKHNKSEDESTLRHLAFHDLPFPQEAINDIQPYVGKYDILKHPNPGANIPCICAICCFLEPDCTCSDSY